MIAIPSGRNKGSSVCREKSKCTLTYDAIVDVGFMPPESPTPNPKLLECPNAPSNMGSWQG